MAAKKLPKIRKCPAGHKASLASVHGYSACKGEFVVSCNGLAPAPHECFIGPCSKSALGAILAWNERK